MRVFPPRKTLALILFKITLIVSIELEMNVSNIPMIVYVISLANFKNLALRTLLVMKC